MRKANSIYCNTILRKKRSRYEKIIIFISIYLLTIMYGSKRWTTIDTHASRITSAEMKFFRRIMEKTRRNLITKKK